MKFHESVVTDCRVIIDKLMGMMKLHIFNFSLWMWPNDLLNEKSDNNIQKWKIVNLPFLWDWCLNFYKT